MAGITDKVLIEKMFGGSTDMSFGRIKVSDINSKSVQEQMRAAGIDTNSKAYKKVIGNMMAASNGMGYTNIQGIKNQLKNYDKDGDYISPVNGLAGLDATGIPLLQRHVIIKISDKSRQEMFNNAKREFLAEKGIANGDTTRRSDVFTNYQKSVPKKDRLKGTWTLEQYERQYNQAFYDAAKAADPTWKPGKDIPAGALDGITRESIDRSLIKVNGTYGETFQRGFDARI